MNLTPKWRRRLTRIIELLVVVTVVIAAASLWQWYQKDGGFEAIYVAVGVLLAALWTTRRWLRREGEAVSSATMPSLSPRSRENLLNHMQTAWIDGFLKQSLHREVLKLTIHYRPDAVGVRPWQLALREPGQPDAPVPPERSLLALFTASGRSLLILGEPGSGKTITMLQLAETMIEMARQDAAAPLPIILNLSSWAQTQKPLAEWMAEELFVQYGLARDLTRAAIAQNQFLYLLDGLDEVATDARADCLAAINTFKEAHLAEMVVCSRVAEYEALQARLHMGTALQIQPLTDAQIDAYLAQEGLELQAARAMLVHDPDLRDLARAPLILSLMALAYRGLTPVDLQPLADKTARRRHLFDHYVQRMFARRPLPSDAPYTQAQATRWLANLAQGMAQHAQSVFYIDRLQPTWLHNNRLHRYYQLFSGLIGGLIFGLIAGLIVGLIGGLIVGLIVGLIFGLFVGLIGGLQDTVSLREVLNWRWVGTHRFLLAFGEGFVLGTLPGLIGGVAGEFRLSFISTLMVGLLLGLIGGLINERILGRSDGLIVGLIGGLAFGLIVGLIGGLFVGLIGGLILGLTFGLILECFERQETETRLVPNQSIRRAAWNAAAFALLGGLGGLVYGLILWQLDGCLGWLCFTPYFRFGGGLWGGIQAGVPAGLTVSVALASFYGLDTVIQHYTLRCLLLRVNVLPYPFRDSRLVAFLDAMHERILLRRVGGGWVFVHRSLLEYFASLSPNAPNDP